MATTADTSQLPIGYRAVAAAITVIVHALVLHSALFWQAGDRSQQHRTQGNSVGEEAIQVEFVPAHREIAPAPAPAVGKAVKPSTLVVIQPMQKPVRISTEAVASAAIANSQTSSHPAGVRKQAQLNPDDGYRSAVRAAVVHEWQTNGGRGILAGCVISIDQIKGGKAVRAWTTNCTNLTVSERIRLETAVMRAQLPYNGFESLFQAHLELDL